MKTVLFALLALALVTGTAALVTVQTQPAAACGGKLPMSRLILALTLAVVLATGPTTTLHQG
jgi:hypothetical protein